MGFRAVVLTFVTVKNCMIHVQRDEVGHRLYRIEFATFDLHLFNCFIIVYLLVCFY